MLAVGSSQQAGCRHSHGLWGGADPQVTLPVCLCLGGRKGLLCFTSHSLPLRVQELHRGSLLLAVWSLSLVLLLSFWNPGPLPRGGWHFPLWAGPSDIS